jgi:hypothetical protein
VKEIAMSTPLPSRKSATGGKARWLAGAGVIAAATALASGAGAQTAFQGTPTVVTPGSAIVQQGPAGTDTIFVLAPEAIINWRVDSPPPGNVNFLPNGRTGRFVGFNDFVVLNRILPVDGAGAPISRLIELNGIIRSEIDLSNQGGGIVQGGAVWFYSAGGILVGNSAVINVGSLVLTSNDIVTTGGLFGGGGQIRFVGSDTSGTVTIASGAQINALQQNNPGTSYVALVAPRVEQRGTIRADGSVAMVAAQVVDVTVNNGLFDIFVSTGTDDPNGIVHTGDTGGAAQPAGGAGPTFNRTYLVAVPQSTALTMLLGGTIGHAGVTATAQDGAIVISAGRDIEQGAVSPFPGPTGAPEANVQLSDLIARNDLVASATGGIDISSSNPACNNCAIFDAKGSVFLRSDKRVSITAGRGQQVNVAGLLEVEATDAENAVGGEITITAGLGGVNASNPNLAPGQINIGGDLIASVFARGRNEPFTEGAAFGGKVTVSAAGGSITAREIVLDAEGAGVAFDGANGGPGTGGTAILEASNNGLISTTGISVIAVGRGGNRAGVGNGGDGIGGTAEIKLTSGGSIRMTGDPATENIILVDATGLGAAGTFRDGDGSGGTARITIADSKSSLTASKVEIRAQGRGGGERADATIPAGVVGGNGTGGLAELLVSGTLKADLVVVDALADSFASRENLLLPDGDSPLGGEAAGGNARVEVTDGIVNVGSIEIYSEAYGGNVEGLNGLAGSGRGGETSLTLKGNAEFTAAGRVYLTSVGEGGLGQDSSGNGTGGKALVDVAGSKAALRAGSLEIFALGNGGGAQNGGPNPLGLDTAHGGDGFGGTTAIRSAGLIDVGGFITMLASGQGGQAVVTSGDPRAPQGGSGTGGVARLTAEGGKIVGGLDIEIGVGGTTGKYFGATGNADGGDIFVSVNNGSITSGGSAILNATASAETGAALAGNISITVANGRFATTGTGRIDALAAAFAVNGKGGTIDMAVTNGGLIEYSELFGVVSGTNAGRISLSENSAGRGISLGNLILRAEGIADALTGISFKSEDGAIGIDGDALLETSGNVSIDATGSGGVQVGRSVTMRAVGNVTGTHVAPAGTTLRSGTTIDIKAGGLVDFGAGTSLFSDLGTKVTGGTGVKLANVEANKALSVVATTGDVTIGNAASGEGTFIGGGNVTIGSSSTGGAGDDPTDIVINATGKVNLGKLDSADSILINAVELLGPGSSLTAGKLIDIKTAGQSQFGDAKAGGDITVTSGTTITGGSAAGANISLTSNGTQTIGAVDAGGTATLLSNGANIAAGNVKAGDAVLMQAATGIVVTSATSSGGGVSMKAGTAIDAGTVSAATTITANGGADVNIANSSSTGTTTVTGQNVTLLNSKTTGTAGDIIATATQVVTVGKLVSGRDVAVTAGSLAGINSSTSAAGKIAITTDGDANFGSMDAGGNLIINSGGVVNGTSAKSSTGAVGVTATGNITLDSATAATTLNLGSKGNVDLRSGSSGGNMQLDGQFISVTSLTTTGAGSDILLNAATGGVGALGGGAPVTITSAGDVTVDAGFFQIGGTGSIKAADAVNVTAGLFATFGSVTGGTGVTINSGSGVTGNNVTTTAPGANVAVNGAGLVSVGTVTSSGGATLSSKNDAVNVQTATAAGALTLTAGTAIGALNLTSTGGSVQVNGSSITAAKVTAATTATLIGTGLVNLGTGSSGSNFRVDGKNINIGSITTKGGAGSADILINATGALAYDQLGSAEDIVMGAGSLTNPNSTAAAAGAINATIGGNTVFGDMTGAAGVTVTSGGTLSGSSVRSTGANAPVSLSGANGLTMAQVLSTGATSLSATNGALSVGTLQSAAPVSAIAQSVQIGGNAGLNFATLKATNGAATVTMTNGDLSVTSGSASGALTLSTKAGSLTTGTLNADSIALTSSGKATLNGATTAATTLGITATGAATINAAATGTTIAVSSGDIVIGAGGQLGSAGRTTTLSLTNNDAGARTFIGGADTTQGYSLSAAEIARLFANDIGITAPRAATQGGAALGLTRPPDVVIGAFTLQGDAGPSAGNLGPSGTLTITTPGFARVIGAVEMQAMSATNRLLINADESLEIIAGQGSIRLTNGAALAGILDLRSQDIAVATPAAITAIAGMTDIAQINTRLGQNDGIILGQGVISANAIRMTVRGGAYIQNTGTSTNFADRRGFLTGAGGLTINTAGTATRIVVNGQVPNAAGVLTSGPDTIPLVAIVGGGAPAVTPGGYATGSTINGCLIANPAACIDRADDPGVPPVQDAGGAFDGVEMPPFALLIELRDNDPLPNEPLIDDPVTGAGNDDNWDPSGAAECEAGSTAEGCPAPGGG